jgi:diguanylate cyclase (GGDEF)-like protein
VSDRQPDLDGEVREAQDYLRALGADLAAAFSPASEVERRLRQVTDARWPGDARDSAGRMRTRSALGRIQRIARHLLALRVPRRALRPMTRRTYTYIALVIAAGMPLLGYAMARAISDPGALVVHGAAAVALLAALIVVGDLRPILARHENDGATTALALSLALLTLAGWPAAVLAQSLAVVVHGLLRRHVWWRIAFNLAQYPLCLAAGGAAVNLTHLHPAVGTSPNWRMALAVATAGVVYVVANHLLVWVAIAQSRDVPLWVLVRREAPHQIRAAGAMVALAPVVLVLAQHSVWLLPVLFLVVKIVHGNALAGREREWEATHDPVTELPNLKFLRLLAEQSLVDADRCERAVGLVLLDIENLKQVNDTLGRLAGDELLREAATRLVRAVQPEDSVARLDGGEFAVLLPGVRGRSAAGQAVQGLLDALTGQVLVHGVSLDLNLSVGLALYPDDADAFEGMLQRADLARRLDQSPEQRRPHPREPQTADTPC